MYTHMSIPPPTPIQGSIFSQECQNEKVNLSLKPQEKSNLCRERFLAVSLGFAYPRFCPSHLHTSKNPPPLHLSSPFTLLSPSTHRGTALREIVTFYFQCVALEMLEGHPCRDVIQEYVYTSLELKKRFPGGTSGRALLLMQET